MIRQNFNADWIFYSAEKPDEKKIVHLPHDAMRYEKRIPNLKNGGLFGFYPSGDYYYEKNLFGDESLRDKTVILEFEGIYMDSHVYLNGEEIGGRVYGYSNFYVDISGTLRIGEDNLIKVFVHNSQVPNGRWYTGSGIYRPVKLMVGEKTHIAVDGVKIITKSYEPAVLSVSVTCENALDAEVYTEIRYNGETVAFGQGAECEITVPEAKLWDEYNPNLYEARVTLQKDGAVLDEVIERIGIRHLAWNPGEGLLINGKQVKLRGGCVHHDNGLLGAASFPAAEFRRVKKLKEAGYNAIRSSHNPISKSALDACDELGMYVLDESFDTWFENNGTYGYVLYFEEEWEKDTISMVLKDINHPSVIMYSTGNEISETATEKGVEYGEKMIKAIKRYDESRPVTCCVNLMMNVMKSMGQGFKTTQQTEFNKDDVVNPKETSDENIKMGGSVLFNFLASTLKGVILFMSHAGPSDKPTRGIFSKMDVAGYNYGHAAYEGHKKRHPERIIFGSETIPVQIYDNWKKVADHPYVIGDFTWTAWEYLGECGAGVIDYDENAGFYSKPYPVIMAGTGTHDITGFRDGYAYLAGVVWNQYKKPYIGVRPPNLVGRKVFYSNYRESDAISSWSFSGYEGKKTEVTVYSIGHSVELQINGKSQGKKKLKKCEAKFDVTYQHGEIVAISFDRSGKEIARDKLVSAEAETSLTAIPERCKLSADCEDVVYINVALTDKAGITKPLQSVDVKVEVEGAAVLEAVGSGNPRVTVEESYIHDHFTTYFGRMAAVLRSNGQTGNIKVKISAEGLEPVTLVLAAE